MFIPRFNSSCFQFLSQIQHGRPELHPRFHVSVSSQSQGRTEGQQYATLCSTAGRMQKETQCLVLLLVQITLIETTTHPSSVEFHRVPPI